ncbi:uncharacterized protein F5Z01DRAFT_328470 [Emericellopsis atlantica]|uniref:NAD-dependent epimerase/dehydratase domain-containing protein n=1 Tax=Emericellopsis atlantica TaxID=2614577 RepID=A0A9P7ZG69_9HYPO|nr:uncharacterized protein F5Z01DRAFT_328470 [Emericellopsis atlantica]KAG9250985.1 hypothetical protein F5Z01DRAFT_328470 [Emericellopsis atlantica]
MAVRHSTPAGALASPCRVLVTGGNGFIAQHTIAVLLGEGYSVVTTVRSEEKVDAVRETHNGHGDLTIVVVGDITSTDAYLAGLENEAIDAILHLAAPFTYATQSFETDLMIPSVQGAEAALHLAEQLGVKRVVQTNSFACIYDASLGPRPDKIYSAKDWAPLTYDDGVRAKDAPTAYRASKVAAERAAWDFMKQSRCFDLVSLCPGMVFGPWLDAPTSVKSINTSNMLVYNVVSLPEQESVPPTKAPVWVHVRDVAKAHVQALRVPEAGGKRFLLAANVYCNQEIADVTREVIPPAVRKGRVPIGQVGKREHKTHFGIDVQETEDILGLQWTDLGTCLGELVPQLYAIQDEDSKV